MFIDLSKTNDEIELVNVTISKKKTIPQNQQQIRSTPATDISNNCWQ